MDQEHDPYTPEQHKKFEWVLAGAAGFIPAIMLMAGIVWLIKSFFEQ